MREKVFNILQEIGINAYYLECQNKEIYYCIYSTYDEKETELYDNKYHKRTYYVTINYCYSKENAELDIKYKDIISAMKTDGFKYDGCKDVIGETHYIKNMDFVIKSI